MNAAIRIRMAITGLSSLRQGQRNTVMGVHFRESGVGLHCKPQRTNRFRIAVEYREDHLHQRLIEPDHHGENDE